MPVALPNCGLCGSAIRVLDGETVYTVRGTMHCPDCYSNSTGDYV
jgi:hypothetical protein